MPQAPPPIYTKPRAVLYLHLQVKCGLLATGVFSGDSVSRHPGALSSQHEARVVYLELNEERIYQSGVKQSSDPSIAYSIRFKPKGSTLIP
jgi:hypothetical protein